MSQLIFCFEAIDADCQPKTPKTVMKQLLERLETITAVYVVRGLKFNRARITITISTF